MLAIGLLILSACSGKDDKSSATKTTEPVASNASSTKDSDDAMIACLRKAGVDAEFDPVSNSVVYTYKDEQAEAARGSYEQCEKELKAAGILKDPPPVTKATLEADYEKKLALQKCLEKEGIPPGETPSKAAFVDSQGMWSPYQHVPRNVGEAEWERLSDACPQF